MVCPTLTLTHHLPRIHPIYLQLFFDDEIRNNEVESLGVTFCLVPNGVDDRTFERGLAEWRRRHAVEVTEDDNAST